VQTRDLCLLRDAIHVTSAPLKRIPKWRPHVTNLQIQRQAKRFAARLARREEFLEPEDAWHRWSIEHRIYSPAARCVFEQMYQARMARAAKH
jgi:hypothetical protein